MDNHTVDTAAANKIAPVYLFWNDGMLIRAPIENVWPHVLNYSSWQNFSIAQHISGVPGEEGEVVLLKKEEGAVETPPYYARTIKLNPTERQIIWKTYPEKRTQGLDYFGIVEFSLLEAEGGTRFCYDVLYEFLVPYRDERELAAFRKHQSESSQAVFSTVLQKLKRLVEQGLQQHEQ